MTKFVWQTLLFIGLLAIISACQSDSIAVEVKNRPIVIPSNLPGDHFVAMVETPIGEYRSISVDLSSKSLDTLKAEDKYVINAFLPHPVNQAFIPLSKGGAPTKLPVWIIGIPKLAGDTITIDPLGLIEYTMDGEKRSEIVAIPADPTQQTIHPLNFTEFIIEYDAVKYLVEGWLRNRQGLGKVNQLTWKDQVKAQNYINDLLSESE